MNWKKIKSFMFLSVVILIIGCASYAYNKDIGVEEVSIGVETAVQVIEEVKDSEVDSVMNEPEFKKKVEMEAKKIVFERERDAEIERNDKAKKAETERHNKLVAEEKARHDKEEADEKERHDAKIAEIEAKLQSVRSDALSFQSAPEQKNLPKR